LLLPWQTAWHPIASGVIYTPGELAGLPGDGPLGSGTAITFGQALIYLRFTGYWVLAAAVLVLAQSRSGRWSKIAIGKLKDAVQMNHLTQAQNLQESNGV